MGLRIKQAAGRATRGQPAPERYFDASLASQNRGLFGRRGPFAEGGLHGIHQLSAADPGVAKAWRTVAGSPTLADLSLKNTAEMIEGLGGKGSWEKFKQAMTEDQLRGMQKGYERLARRVGAMSPDQVVEDYGSTPYGTSGRLGAIADSKIFARERLAEKADKLYESGKGTSLRSLLVDAFGRAADSVGRTSLSDEELSAIKTAPWFQEAHQIAKANLIDPLEEAHLKNEGVPLQFPGELGYWPLVPKEGEGFLGRATKFGRPRNPGQNYRTGLGDDYDLSTAALRDRIRRAYVANNTADAMRTTEAAGLMRQEGTRPSRQTFDYGGRTFTAGRLERFPNSVVPEWAKDEIDPILARSTSKWRNPITGEMEPRTPLGKAASLATQTALLGPAEGVGHTMNLIGAAVAKIPYFENTGLGRALSLPVIKNVFTVLPKILAEKVTGPEIQATLREMAENGELMPRYLSKTWSKGYADLTGATRSFGLAPLIYGPHGIDIKTRVYARRIAQAIEPGISDQKLFEFSNNFGQYNKGLQDTVATKLKGSGLSPFYTASSTMSKNAVDSLAGTGVLPGGAGTRAAAMINGGALGVTAAWVLAYKQYTGKYPWQDPKMKLFQIPLNSDDRQSDFAKALWGPPSKGTAYVNIGRLLSPMVERGGRVMGIRGAAETLARGGTGGQAQEAALKDVANAVIGMAAGPPVRATTALVAGVEPYISSMRENGKPGLSLMPISRERTEPGPATWKERAKAAAMSLNPLAERAEQSSVRGTPARIAADTFLPNVVTGPSHPERQRFFLQKELKESRKPTRP
jgi:hypothetical protein